MNPQLILSETDARRVRVLLSSPPRGLEPEGLERLRREVENARIVPDNEVPEDVITVNSIVEIEDLEDGEVDTYTLVLPAEANPSQGKISLVAPLGMGMLGYREGDEFEWPVPGGTARYRVRKLLGNAAREGRSQTVAAARG
jgi:regulator of nucleoside diphosphate kinase